MEKDKFLALAGAEYDRWLESQKGQTDAYEYERSFSGLMDRIALGLLQGSVGKVPGDTRKKKTMTTKFGCIEVGNSHCMSSSPKGFRISPLMQELMLYAGQGAVYVQAAHFLSMFLPVEVDPKQVERLVHGYGEAVGEAVNEAESLLLPSDGDDEPTYVMSDGSMVLTRTDGWQEVKVGRIFKESERLAMSGKRNFVRKSEYMAHLGGHGPFLEQMEARVDRLGNPVFIADGAKYFWKWAVERYPGAIQILDFFHAGEYLAPYAKEQFRDEKTATEWCEAQKALLLEDGVELVIENIGLAIPPTKAAIAQQKRILTYYTNNAHRMKYKTYMESGLLIGSGAMESAHRTVIQHRLKKSGQRWTPKGAQAVINIRVANMSGKWSYVVAEIRKAS